MYKFQDIDNWESAQMNKAQKEDSIYNYYRDQLYVYGEIDPNSFSLKYENGESITEFSIKIPKATFDEDDNEKSIETEIRHRIGDNYVTKEGHWQLSYVDVIDNDNKWLINIMIRNGQHPIG